MAILYPMADPADYFTDYGVDNGGSEIIGNGDTFVVFTNDYNILPDSVVEPFSEPVDSSGVPLSGSGNDLVPLKYTKIQITGSAAPYTCTVYLTAIPASKYYKVKLRVTNDI